MIEHWSNNERLIVARSLVATALDDMKEEDCIQAEVRLRVALELLDALGVED